MHCLNLKKLSLFRKDEMWLWYRTSVFGDRISLTDKQLMPREVPGGGVLFSVHIFITT